MRKATAISMEQTLRQIGAYVRSQSKAKKTRTSKRTVDGRITQVRVSPGGAVTLDITMGGTDLHGSWDGSNKLVFWGIYRVAHPRTGGIEHRPLVDEQVLYLIRESLKRTHPTYKLIPALDRKVTIQPVVRMTENTVVQYR